MCNPIKSRSTLDPLLVATLLYVAYDPSDLSTDGRKNRSGERQDAFSGNPGSFALPTAPSARQGSFEEERWNGPSDGVHIVSYAYIGVQDSEWSRFTWFLPRFVNGDIFVRPTIVPQGAGPSHRTVYRLTITYIIKHVSDTS